MPLCLCSENSGSPRLFRWIACIRIKDTFYAFETRNDIHSRNPPINESGCRQRKTTCLSWRRQLHLRHTHLRGSFGTKPRFRCRFINWLTSRNHRETWLCFPRLQAACALHSCGASAFYMRSTLPACLHAKSHVAPAGRSISNGGGVLV
jgi:hypothetical protein